MSSVSFGIDGIYNPLLNHLIIEKIVRHLDKNHRKNCRLVCSNWNSAIINAHLVKDFILVLDDNDHNYNLETFVHSLTTSTLPIPQFESIRIKIGGSVNSENKLWECSTSSFIRYLTLDISTGYSQENLADLLLYNLNNLQNVKILIRQSWNYSASATNGNTQIGLYSSNKRYNSCRNRKITSNYNLIQFSYINLTSIEDIHVSENSSLTEFKLPFEFNELLIRYPNIKCLSFIGLSSQETTELISCLASDNSQEYKLCLKKLEILNENMCSTEPHNGHLQSLTESAKHHCCNLEELCLELIHHLDNIVLLQLLRELSKSLKILRLRRFPLMNVVPITLSPTVLPNVTLLEVSDQLMENMHFLTNVPALVTLNIIMRDYSCLQPTQILQNTDMDNIEPHNGVRNLFIEQPLISEECVTRLCQLFPELFYLKIRMNNSMLKELCRNPSCNLTQLYITSWDGLTDQGFTGIADNLLKNMGQVYDLEEYRNQPYIGLLKSLKILTVEMWPDYCNNVSDASIYFGVMDLPTLTNFRGIRTRITSAAVNRLSSSVNWCLN